MTRSIALMVVVLTGLAACGVDGTPERPDPRPETGLHITGTAEVGVSGGS